MLTGDVFQLDKRRVSTTCRRSATRRRREQQQRTTTTTSRQSTTTTSTSKPAEKTAKSNGYSSFKPAPKFSANDGSFSFMSTNGTNFTFRTGGFDTPKDARFTFLYSDDAPRRAPSKPFETRIPDLSAKESYTGVRPRWRTTLGNDDDDDDDGSDFFANMQRAAFFRDAFTTMFVTFDHHILDPGVFRGGGGPDQNVRQDLGLQFGGGVPRPRKPDLENGMWDWSQPMFQHRKKSSSAEDYGYSEDDGSSKCRIASNGNYTCRFPAILYSVCNKTGTVCIKIHILHFSLKMTVPVSVAALLTEVSPVGYQHIPKYNSPTSKQDSQGAIC